MLFQDICQENIVWDVKLEGQFKHRWEEIVKHLLSIKTIDISRCIYRHPKRVIRECFVHGFRDASTKGYCVVVYLVYHTSAGVYTTLLTTKYTAKISNNSTIRTYVRKNFGTING